MSDTATVHVQSVELKDGVSQKTGKPYKRVVLTDGNGNFASSFDVALFQKAKPFEGQQAVIETQPNGNFTDLLDIKEVPAGNGDGPSLGTGEYITGQKPSIEVRRIAAAVAWKEATHLADIEMRHTVGREITPALIYDAAEKFANRIFVDLLRKGGALTDEDIPF